MSKKKGGKRLNKRALQEMLQTLFQQNPNETFSFKQVFKALKLDTHPTKMMAVDLMERWRGTTSCRRSATTRIA